MNSGHGAEEDAARMPPWAALVARFIRFYGVATYRNARWPTADGVIPVRLFWQLYREMPGAAALEQLRAYETSFLAFAQVMGGKDARPALDRMYRTLTDRADLRPD